MNKLKRFGYVLLYVIVLGFVLRQAEYGHIAFALFLGAVLFDFRRLKPKSAKA